MITEQEVIDKTEKRVWQRISFAGENECWNWTGIISKSGYAHIWSPMIKWKRKFLKVSRLIYAAIHGEFDRSFFVLHSCDNRKCVNPNHLRLGTVKDNSEDMVRRGRWNGGIRPIGSKHGLSKLTEENVKVIKKRLAAGEFQYVIAESFGVSQCTIWHISAGNTWRHVQLA